jgi:hypothetical protein
MLAEKLFHNGRSEPDRMRIVVEGIMGMND